MRYILGLCAVLAVGNPAWTSEMSRIATEPEFQAPSAITTAPVTQPTGSPVLPAMSPAVAYQTATAQPTTPVMVSQGTYTVGTQPIATYAPSMPNTTYIANSYPAQVGNGMFPMTSPVYSYPSMPGTTTYSAPVQTYTVMPGQSYYEPVQRRFGLFQRWRQQVTPAYNSMPVYGAPVYGAPVYGGPVYGAPVYGGSVYSAPGYPAAVYAAPVYTTYSYSTPAYSATTYVTPATTLPTNSLTPARAMAPSTTPIYTPTMLDVPNATPAAGATSAGTAPADPAFQGATPAPTVPAPPGAVQGTSATPARTIPSPPPIPRSNPG